MKMYVIHPEGQVQQAEVGRYALMAMGRQFCEGPVELVSVLFDGKPATMLVNEIGASADPELNPKGLLPANARATAIYWTATIQGVTGMPFDPMKAPMIHGTVVLVDMDKRQL